jgi:hypothetical protein
LLNAASISASELGVRNVHALRILFNCAFRLADSLGPSWVLVVEVLCTLDRLLPAAGAGGAKVGVVDAAGECAGMPCGCDAGSTQLGSLVAPCCACISLLGCWACIWRTPLPQNQTSGPRSHPLLWLVVKSSLQMGSSPPLSCPAPLKV